MAAWLVPSLAVLPWLREGPLRREPGLDVVRAALAVGLPNLGMWILVILTYYRGSAANLFADLMTGAFSYGTYQGGNALGGANNQWFLTTSAIISPDHVRRTCVYLFLYSPFAFVAVPALMLTRPRAAGRRIRESSPARLLLALLVPYVVYVFTWEADLGYANDWDLFSHVTIFAVLFGLVLVPSLTGAAWRRLVVIGSLVLSLATTARLVIDTHRSDTPTGMSRVFQLLGDHEADPPTRPPRRRPGEIPRDSSPAARDR
jgi:hypothetical protein